MKEGAFAAQYIRMCDELTRRDVIKIAGAVAAAAPLMQASGELSTTGGWYARSYRKLFFDYHSHSTSAGLASAFDAERWARQVQETNAQAVSVTAKCGRGWSYYRKGHVRHVHPLLPEGLDMLGEQVHALHRRGIRTIGYYETFQSERLRREQPDWLMLDEQGAPRRQGFCLIGPLAQEHLLPHVAEIVSNYEVDAMFFDGTYAKAACYCPTCRRRFREFAGAEIPKAQTDLLWPKYLNWYLAQFEQLRQRIGDTIHKTRPGLPVSYNWAYSMRLPGIPPAQVSNLVGDVAPADDQVFSDSYHARFWSMLGKPFDVMNSAFLQWWGDWGCKPAVAMQQEIAPIVANGGLTWIGYQMTPSFEVPAAVMEQMGKAMAFVKEREQLLENAVPVPNIAILHTTRAQMARGKAAFQADEGPTRGAHRLFLETGMPHHFVNEQTLAAWLKDCRAVVLPDVRYVPPPLAAAMEEWVRGGGVLLATYRSGTEDDDGRSLSSGVLADLLGVRIERDYERPEAYIEVTDTQVKQGALDMPHLIHAPFAFALPSTGVEIVARLRKCYLRSDGTYYLRFSPTGEDSGYPAITRRRVGKGTAIWIAGEVFRGLQTHGQWCVKPIVANLLKAAMGAPLVRVEAPAWLEITLMRQGRRTIVHLVNHHGNRALLDRHAGTDANNLYPEQILPVPHVTVHLARAARPAKVTLEPGAQEAHWTYADGFVRVVVPEVHIHRAVTVS